MTKLNSNRHPDWGKVQLALQDAAMELELIVHRVIYKRTGTVSSKCPQLFDVVAEEKLEPLTCDSVIQEVSNVISAVQNACRRNEQ